MTCQLIVADGIWRSVGRSGVNDQRPGPRVGMDVGLSANAHAWMECTRKSARAVRDEKDDTYQWQPDQGKCWH
eukprot:scaffold138325_cov32-Tisochrysis_lutea.AAC.1